jgi:LmbE family N-acetylglucosaminyl deacetylase
MLRIPGRIRRYLVPSVRAGTLLRAMRELPLVAPNDLFGEAPVLILAPHPDDESLGCGGLIAECCSSGHPVNILVLTDGAGSHPRSRKYSGSRLATLRAEEARNAADALGLPLDRIDFLGLSDGHAPLRGKALRSTAARIAAFARERDIGTICTTWQHDPHRDHLAAYRLGKLVAEAIGVKLLCYPVWGWTVPENAWLRATPILGGRLDITGHLAAKQRAIACYQSQTTDLIADDPSGFRLSPGVLATFERPFEVFTQG